MGSARSRAAVALLVALGATAISLAVGAASGPSARFAPGGRGLPGPPRMGLTVPPSQDLEHVAGESRWAPVTAAVPARISPSPSSPVVTVLSTRTPEGTANLVQVLGRAVRGPGGQLWERARLPVLPNDTTGWIPRSHLGDFTVLATQLVVDRTRFTATLYRAGRVVFKAPVGVGQRQWPTPPGHFYVRDRLTSFRSPAYGPLAFGTSARSSVLTDWPNGGFVGIHGTDRPDILPGRVSHGCIRLRDGDILALGRLMPVGTPITVR